MNDLIEQRLREDGVYVSTTVGISMRPMLRNRRDRIVVRAVTEGECLARYDLPLYRYPDGRYVLHRIIGVRENEYLIRGDNTYVVEHIPKTWILGVVSEFYRGDRHWSTDDRRYRRYAAVWNAIYPVRALLHLPRALAGRVYRKMFGGKRKKKS
jgi:hypothetical protein